MSNKQNDELPTYQESVSNYIPPPNYTHAVQSNQLNTRTTTQRSSSNTNTSDDDTYYNMLSGDVLNDALLSLEETSTTAINQLNNVLNGLDLSSNTDSNR
ncbi:hypothetical protein BN7_898 [Wickerhamomyces ciferrii]|uniref:Uncharacterized protein n=1 Tax=Wickerhamomyces ciferrii (strain ATCC 14091 / BCRC 22168 / CBS 111 / JCM 3599 / NBRC 0793 / NRRL Y-1031 F-60-10) TaxID=1206466 RepID=K0KIV5_WICCF|nr:uncharacterized protein BN7_898 [Wickerhamomyces ciferrii]CCH41359.1 hypothetical protein BN7_898 [Wickerhamomyces ciferrii]